VRGGSGRVGQLFLRTEEAKTVKNRLHLDVRVGVGLTGDERVSVLEAEAARLQTLGARRLRLLPADEENEASGQRAFGSGVPSEHGAPTEDPA
jgi:hypothetical protein